MTDTHTHLYTAETPEESKAMVERALASGVRRMIFPAIDGETMSAMEDLHDSFPDNTYIAIGLHPTELGDNPFPLLDKMEERLVSEPKRFKAIGETGLDLYWDKSTLEMQRQSFSRQYDWAVKYKLPLIIHCREALDQILEIISSKTGDHPKIIFHSFTSGPDDVAKIREVCNPYFGINGVVTFKNASSLRESLPVIGINRILLETDSPYLAPVPYRGKKNESCYLGLIRDKIAETLDIPYEEVERITDKNAAELFGWEL